MHLAALDEVNEHLLPALERLEHAFAEKASEFADVVKTGRTHLMDAVPVTLGQEFAGYAAQVRLGRKRVTQTLPHVGQIPLGGTATGTGLNTHPEFAEHVRSLLHQATGLEINPPEDPFEAQGNRDALVELSGGAQGRGRLVHQDRQRPRLDGLWSARRPGGAVPARIAEGQLDHARQGDPVICEVVLQVGAQVIGNDMAITVAGTQGTSS